jgi:hypothetical protein
MPKSIFPFSLAVNARRFNPLEGQQGQAPRVLWALMQFKRGCSILYEKVCAVAATHKKDIEEHQETGECQEEKKKKKESC